jgi:hypothetical protein
MPMQRSSWSLRVPHLLSVTLVAGERLPLSNFPARQMLHLQICGRNAFHWAVLGLDAIVIRRLMDQVDSSVWDSRDVSFA